MKLNINKQLSDLEVVEGMQNNVEAVKCSFFLSCQRYFNERHNRILFGLPPGAREAQDIFQDSFILLWNEIEVRRIFVSDDHVWRIDHSGVPRRMKASLKTYLMAVARYKNYEALRENLIYGPESETLSEPAVAPEESEEDTWAWIARQSVARLPQRCKEILTMFYFEEKSLDEILDLRHENQSKNGLKTGKSKCMKSAKEMIQNLSKFFNLKPYGN